MRGIVVVGIVVLGLMAASGCAHKPPNTDVWADAWRWTASADSLSLTAFLDLPASAVESRRSAADDHLERSRRARTHADRMKHLIAAAGLTPDDAHLWLDLARECSDVGDVDRALSCIQAAQAALPRVPGIKRADLKTELAVERAWLHRDKGQWVMAHAWADSAVSWSPNERGVLVVLGIVRASHGDVPGALNVAKDIELKHPTWFEWRWIRGMTEVARGRNQDAYHWLRDVRPERPWSKRFWCDLATVCEWLGDREEAEIYHRYALNALGLPPGTTTEIRTSVPSEDGGTLDLPLWRAYDHLPAAGSRLGWALVAADSALAWPGKPSPVWADVASVLLSVCIRMNVAEHLCRERRGLIYAEMGAKELAREDFRRLVADVGYEGIKSSDALSWYGRLLLEDRRWREAAVPLRKAVAMNVTDARSWGDYGLALLMSRQDTAGEEALGRALELDPGLAAAWFNRGLARYHAQRWDEAVADLEQARSLAPDNDEILNVLQQAAQRARVDRER